MSALMQEITFEAALKFYPLLHLILHLFNTLVLEILPYEMELSGLSLHITLCQVKISI